MEGRRCPQRSEPAVLTKFVPPPGPHHSKGVLHGLPASPIFRFESSGYAPAPRCARGLPLKSNGDPSATRPRTRNGTCRSRGVTPLTRREVMNDEPRDESAALLSYGERGRIARLDDGVQRYAPPKQLLEHRCASFHSAQPRR